jgi:hypothetical protein
MAVLRHGGKFDLSSIRVNGGVLQTGSKKNLLINFRARFLLLPGASTNSVLERSSLLVACFLRPRERTQEMVISDKTVLGLDARQGRSSTQGLRGRVRAHFNRSTRR